MITKPRALLLGPNYAPLQYIYTRKRLCGQHKNCPPRTAVDPLTRARPKSVNSLANLFGFLTFRSKISYA